MSTHTNRMPSESRADETATEWKQQIQHYEECVTGAVRDNPLAATLVVFGVGFGIGTAIGSMLGDSTASRQRNLAHSLGRRMMDSLSDVMPASVQHHLRS